MAKESNQHRLDRIRKPRVHLTYDVTIGGAIQEKELPFVVGVMADLSGKPDVALPRLDKRSFVEIDRVNFDKVLAGMKPRLAFQVDNTIEDNKSQFGVELRFNRMEDFEPEQIVQQVEPLRKLLARRMQLQYLRDKLDSQPDLDRELQDVIRNTDRMKKLDDVIGHGTGSDVRLMSSLKDASAIPSEGKDLIIVALVEKMLHFRYFDASGKMVVDTTEKRMKTQTVKIEAFKNQLVGLWPPHELTRSEKSRLISDVTSIIGLTSGTPEEES